MGLAFDRFWDFEGFLLLTEEGEEFSFLAREQAIEDRVRGKPGGTGWSSASLSIRPISRKPRS